MTASTLRIEPLSPNIGAEVFGVDLRQPMSDDVYADVRRALVAHQVIFFRDQPIDVEQHKAFARRFGELFVHPASTPVEGHRELIRIHADAQSKKVAGEEWHTDTSCETSPPMGSVLHMTIVPPVGGDTLFASMYAAYDALSPTVKDLLEPLTAHHSGGAAYRGYYDDTAGKTYPEADHPVVCVHPESAASPAVREQLLHDAHQRTLEVRERVAPRPSVPAHRDAGIPVPLPLAAPLGRVLGQPLHAASRDLGLLPAAA